MEAQVIQYQAKMQNFGIVDDAMRLIAHLSLVQKCVWEVKCKVTERNSYRYASFLHADCELLQSVFW